MFCNRPGTVTNVSIPEKTSQNTQSPKSEKKKKMKERKMEPSVENVELHIHFTESGPARLTGGPLRRAPFLLWEWRMGLCIALGNGLSLSLLSHLTNQPLLEVYPSSLLTAVQMWRRGQDLGRSDTQPQHGVNKRQLLRREWCRELLDKVFRTQRCQLAHTTSAKETFSHVLAVLKGDFRTLGKVDAVSIWYTLYNIQTDTQICSIWFVGKIQLIPP